jgi:uncharacterized delta-60 repeat protein
MTFDSDGAVDPTLSGADLPADFSGLGVSALSIDSAGRILLAGSSETESKAIVARLLPDGVPDPSFGGGDGVAPLPLRQVQHYFIHAIAAAPDGDLFLSGLLDSGAVSESVPTTYGLITALDAAGTPLPGFMPPSSLRSEIGEVPDLGVDSQGRLLAAVDAEGGRRLAVARFNRDGSIDSGFGNSGIASISLSCTFCANAVALAVDAADRPLVLGGRFRLARYTTSGQPDPSFAPGGATATDFGKGFTPFSNDLLLVNGRPIVAGARLRDDGVGQFALARYGSPTCRGLSATAIGTPRNDVLDGTPGPDVLLAGRGADIIHADSGNDIVCAGPGSDRVFGGAGADLLNGEGGGDRLLGQGGVDRLLGRNGEDHLFGGPGPDRLDGGSGLDSVFGQKGNDRLFGTPGEDHLRGGPGRDRVLPGQPRR